MIKLKAFIERPADYQYSIHTLVLEAGNNTRGAHFYEGPISEDYPLNGTVCDISKVKELQFAINIVENPYDQVLSFFGARLLKLLENYEISLRKPPAFEQSILLVEPAGLVMLSSTKDAYFNRSHFARSLLIHALCNEQFTLASLGWSMDSSAPDINRMYWKCATRMNQEEVKKRLINLQLSCDFHGKKESDVISWYESES